MKTLNKNDVIDLLFFETDIQVDSIVGNRFYLSYPPIDVPSHQIKFENCKCYIELKDVANFISANVFGSPINVAFDTSGNWIYLIME